MQKYKIKMKITTPSLKKKLTSTESFKKYRHSSKTETTPASNSILPRHPSTSVDVPPNTDNSLGTSIPALGKINLFRPQTAKQKNRFTVLHKNIRGSQPKLTD